jgi:hypothetical protein
VSKIFINGIGQLDFALIDLICELLALNFVTELQIHHAYFANIAASFALSMIESMLSQTTLI